MLARMELEQDILPQRNGVVQSAENSIIIYKQFSMEHLVS